MILSESLCQIAVNDFDDGADFVMLAIDEFV